MGSRNGGRAKPLDGLSSRICGDEVTNTGSFTLELYGGCAFRCCFVDWSPPSSRSENIVYVSQGRKFVEEQSFFI